MAERLSRSKNLKVSARKRASHRRQKKTKKKKLQSWQKVKRTSGVSAVRDQPHPKEVQVHFRRIQVLQCSLKVSLHKVPVSKETFLVWVAPPHRASQREPQAHRVVPHRVPQKGVHHRVPQKVVHHRVPQKVVERKEIFLGSEEQVSRRLAQVLVVD